MDSYNSMKNKLSATGIYLITKRSNISAELKAYASELDKLFETLDEMEREYFIQTAQSYGISEREKFIGKLRDEYTVEKRREMLILQEQSIGLECSREAFEKTLRGCGLSDFTLTEDFAAQSVTVTVRDTLTEPIQKMIEDKINDSFPAHLNIYFNSSR